MRYTVILQRESDGVTSPSSPACQDAFRRVIPAEEALRKIEEAAELYIEDVQAVGDPLPVEDQREFIELNTSTR
jgi:predicted RNase H-like HicB family nuclease